MRELILVQSASLAPSCSPLFIFFPLPPSLHQKTNTSPPRREIPGLPRRSHRTALRRRGVLGPQEEEKEGEEEGGKEEEGHVFVSSSSVVFRRHRHQRRRFEDEGQRRTVSLADRAGRPFECSIPSAPAAAPTTTATTTGKRERRRGRRRRGATAPRPPSPPALLRSLEGSCLYRIEDSWWTYELCFERHVRQFHREAGGPGGGAAAGSRRVLARAVGGRRGRPRGGGGGGGGGRRRPPPPPPPPPPPLPPARPPPTPSRSPTTAPRCWAGGGGPSSAVSSSYGGGDPCDLLSGGPGRPTCALSATSGRRRRRRRAAPDDARVRPSPAPSSSVQPPPNVILSAKELSTCSYEIVVGVDALCRHRGFRAGGAGDRRRSSAGPSSLWSEKGCVFSPVTVPSSFSFSGSFSSSSLGAFVSVCVILGDRFILQKKEE